MSTETKTPSDDQTRLEHQHLQDLQRLSTEILELERVALDLHTRATKLRMIRDGLVNRSYAGIASVGGDTWGTGERVDWEANKGAKDLMRSIMDYFRGKGKSKRYPKALSDLMLTDDALCFARSMPTAFELAKAEAKKLRRSSSHDK